MQPTKENQSNKGKPQAKSKNIFAHGGLALTQQKQYRKDKTYQAMAAKEPASC